MDAEIEADFVQWMKDNIDKLPVARAAVQDISTCLRNRPRSNQA